MKILQRLSRICKADIHGLMDQFEDKELLLKQYLRDMAAALAQKEVRHKRMKLSLQNAVQRLESTNLEIEKLDQDLEVALKHDKDSLARMLIRKLHPLTDLRAEMEHHVDTLDSNIGKLHESIDRQQLQYQQLKQRAEIFFSHSEQPAWDSAVCESVPKDLTRELSDEAIELELIQRKEALFQNKGAD